MDLLPAGYGLLLLEALVICLQCVLEGIPIGRLRKKYFTPAYLSKHWPGLKGVKSGYPDMGQGRFSDKLTDEEWLAFNCAQRVHQNYLEQLTAILAALLISGLSFPRLAFVAGILYVVGRALYGIGYRANGPTGRRQGALVLDIALVLLLFSAIASSVQLAGGITGCTKFLTSLVHF